MTTTKRRLFTETLSLSLSLSLADRTMDLRTFQQGIDACHRVLRMLASHRIARIDRAEPSKAKPTILSYAQPP